MRLLLVELDRFRSRRAIALMLQPGSERAGAAAYWQGIELLTDETARQYYRDVEVLLTPAEEADWRAADLEGRRMWFDRFWETRAATGGVTATERIAEHYRRLAGARQDDVADPGAVGGQNLLLHAPDLEDLPAERDFTGHRYVVPDGAFGECRCDRERDRCARGWAVLRRRPRGRP